MRAQRHKARPAATPAHAPARSAGPTRATARRKPTQAELVHELEVHQVELEMQNEELRHAQLDLATARDRFVDLYDFAPVGYFTLDSRGMVLEANLTGAAMLGAARKAMRGRGFSRFVVPSHVTQWHQHLRQSLQHEGTRRVELALQKPGGETFHGQLDCALSPSRDGDPTLRVTLTDITQRKLAEMERRIADSAQDAREAERRQVARELHEGLGQRLSALKMELGSLPLHDDAPATRDRVTTMLDTLDEALASVRRIAIELRPLMLDDLGLGAAIEWLAQDTARRFGLDIRYESHEIEPEPDDRTAIAMYRMAQDVLDFVARGGLCAAITVALVEQAGTLVLRLFCNGQGLAAGDCLPPGTPTQGLLDRAHQLGGRIEIGDPAGNGSAISVHMPLQRIPKQDKR